MTEQDILARRAKRLAEDAAQKKRDSVRKPCPLDRRFRPGKTSGDNHPSGYTETRERDVTEVIRYIPYQVVYDDASGSWFRIKRDWYPVTRSRTMSAIPRQILVHGRKSHTYAARIGGVTLWYITAPDWYLARDEAWRLCGIARYDHRLVRVILVEG